MSTQAERTARWIAMKQQARAEQTKPNGVRTKYIETDVADAQSQIVTLRADVERLADQVALLTAKLEAVQADVLDTRRYTKSLPAVQAPQNGGATPWWEWVRQHVTACLDARLAEYSEEVGEALGEKVRDVLEEVGQAMDARKSEIELLRRELTVLRGEVGVERGLQDLRNRVGAAQKMIPQIPAIVAGMRDEAAVAKSEADRKIVELRKAVKDVQHAVAAVRVEAGVAASTVKRGLGQELEVQWEATSQSARMVVRPSIHPDAEKTLREFAAKVIDGSVIQH